MKQTGNILSIQCQPAAGQERGTCHPRLDGGRDRTNRKVRHFEQEQEMSSELITVVGSKRPLWWAGERQTSKEDRRKSRG